MRATNSRQWAVALLVCASLAACVDSPTAAVAPADTENQLASSFDGLSQEQARAGDVDRSEEFNWAALAVRQGVTPTRFEVSNDGQRESYDAFVHSVQWALSTLALRPMGHRSLIAWRKNDDVMQVIIISSQTDGAPILHPYSMRPAQPGGILASAIAGASAAYFERGSRQSAWLGVSGQVKMSEAAVASLGKCTTPNDRPSPAGIACQLATFSVAFDATLAKTSEEKSRVVPTNAVVKKLTAPEQKGAGVKLTFSCVLPLSDRGCG